MAVLAPEKPATQTEPVRFYAPDRPDEGFAVIGTGQIARFQHGFLTTSDPAVIAAARMGVAKGLYHEAEPGVDLVCQECNAHFGNQTAFGLHLAKHYERQAR